MADSIHADEVQVTMKNRDTFPPGRPVSNRLIDQLPAVERACFIALCETVDLQAGEILCEPEKLLPQIYFPVTSVISLVKVLNDHQCIETEQIGNEGMLGATVLLGVDVAPERSIVQRSGTALCMKPTQLLKVLQLCPVATQNFNHYLYVMILQLTQTAICFRFHDVASRLARALLMIQDRAHRDHFHMTHQLLADMLGVQRGGVTIAAGKLQRANIIHYTRGNISILNRRALEAASCGCYSAIMDVYTRLLP